MNIALWAAQGLLASLFLMAGLMKLSKPKSELKDKLGDWVDALSNSSFTIIGLLELIGAIGLVLPMFLNVFPILTIYASLGLALTMIGAMILHINRREFDKIKMNIVLMVMALFVCVGRFFVVPINGV